MQGQSAIEFAGNSRVHIALAVVDLERSRAFYELLLGAAPTKERAGYIKFEPDDPAVNLTLNEVGEASEVRSVAHYGVQVKSEAAVREAVERFERAGYPTSLEENTTCCYAVQDKVWVTDPDGNPWEVFVVTQADAESRKSSSSECCAHVQPEVEAASCC